MAQGFTRDAAPVMRRAAQTTAASIKPAMQQAGIESGRVFGQGVGEGFAALAAFAIASQVRRFFTDTITAATDFESAFAGVRRTVSTTEEGFATLRGEIFEMSRNLPFAAAEIAKVASEAGRLGVEAANIETFTETILKLSTVTGASQEELAGNLARFTTVTQRSLGEVGALSDVLLKLDTASAASATEILHFTERLAPLAARTAITAEEVLALSTGLRQAGVQADAGGTALTRVVDSLNNAVTQGGPKLVQFSELLRLTTKEFSDLVRNDPTQALLQFLEAIGAQGLESQATLAELGLGADRIARSVSALSASVGTLRGFIDGTASSTGELNRQFDIFAQTPEQRLATLRNRFEEARIEIGGKLVPAVLKAGEAIAGLSTPTIALGATAAGIAALGFTYNRLRNILREVGSSLGGVTLTGTQFNLIMAEARRQGVSFSVVLQQLKLGQLELVAATEAGQAATIRATTADSARSRVITGFVAAFKAARAEQKAFAAEQAAAATASAAAQRAALQSAFPGVAFDIATPAAAGTRGLRGVAEAANAARASVGTLGGAVNLLGKAFFAAFAFDIFTQLTAGAANFFDTMVRGKEDIDAVNNSMIRLVASMGEGAVGVTELNVLLNNARVEQIEGWERVGQAISDTFHSLGGALVGSDNPVARTLNNIPVLGSLIETSAEAASRKLTDLTAGFEKLSETVGPVAAQSIMQLVTSSDEFIDRARSMGIDSKNLDLALAPLREKFQDAADSANFMKTNANELIASLRGVGLQGPEIAAILDQLGLSAERSAAGLQTAAEVSTNLSRIMSTVSQAQSAYAAAVRSVAPAFSTFTLETKRGAAAAGRAADAARNAARRIADAERALADARKAAARQIEDAQRRIADAETDAARRIADAQRRLGEVRREALRGSRDAQQALQDFQRALDLRGGAATEEDLIRLRDLEQAAADTFQDNARKVAEAQRFVVQVRIEGDEKIAEAQRRLIEVQEAAADRIADALRRLAQAQEDAARKAERATEAAAKATDNMLKTAGQLESQLRKDLRQLSTFNTQLETFADRTLNLFKGRDKGIAAEFLRELQGMGPKAAPLLKSLNRLTDSEVRKIVGIFKDRIQESKRAADLEWDKFQPNFAGKMAPVVRQVKADAAEMMSKFDFYIRNGMTEAAEITRVKMQEAAADVATFANSSDENFEALQDTIKELNKRGIDINMELHDEDFWRTLNAMKKALDDADVHFTVKADGTLTLQGLGRSEFVNAHGGTIMGSKVQAAAHGLTQRPGQATLLGEYGPEMFVPNIGGAIFRHTDTAKILRALGARGGAVVNNVSIHEVASDPIATARTIAWVLGSEATR